MEEDNIVGVKYLKGIGRGKLKAFVSSEVVRSNREELEGAECSIRTRVIH